MTKPLERDVIHLKRLCSSLYQAIAGASKYW